MLFVYVLYIINLQGYWLKIWPLTYFYSLSVFRDTGLCTIFILTRTRIEGWFYRAIPVSGLLFSSAGSEGGSRLSSRLLILFLSWISSLRRCLTWDDSSGRGCPFTVETQSINHFSQWERCKYVEHNEKNRKLVSKICNSVLQGSLHKLFQAPRHTHSVQNKPHLLLKSHVWDTHMHVRLRSHRPAVDLYMLGLEKYTSLQIFPPLPVLCHLTLWPFWQKEAGLQPKTLDRKSHYLAWRG